MNYSALLHATSYTRLRAIAAKLHLRKHVDDRQQWIAAIHQLWLAPDAQARWLSTLSLPACRALWRLLATPQLPTLHFLADFGPLQIAEQRRMAAAQKTAAHKKWQGAHTASPAQELYDMGLLFGSDDLALDRAQWLTVADDLRQPLAKWLHLQVRRGQTKMPVAEMALHLRFSPTPFVLLHDLNHLLAFARQSATGIRTDRRFPLRAEWQWLAPGLLALQDAAFANESAQRGRDWVRFLCLLAEGAGLLANGSVQPLLWQWLRLPVDEQIVALWQGWLAASPQLCARFGRVALADVAGWQVALSALHKQPAANFSTLDFSNLDFSTLDLSNADFSAADLTHSLLAQSSQLPLPWRHAFSSLQALDQHLDALLAALRLWGVVAQVGQQPMPFVRPLDEESGLEMADSLPEARYQLRGLGAWLLTEGSEKALLDAGVQWQMGRRQWLASQFSSAPATLSPIQPAPAALNSAALNSSVLQSSLWHLFQQSDGDPESLLLLAPFCASITLEPSDPHTAKAGTWGIERSREAVSDGMSEGVADGSVRSRWMHHLQISGPSLALAASRGYAAADIWQFSQQSGLPLQPAEWQLLQHWLQAGSALRLQPSLLLVCDDAELMRRIQQKPALHHHLGEMLTPTVAIWQGKADEWAEILRTEGFYPVALPSPSQAEESAPAPAMINESNESNESNKLAGEIPTEMDRQITLNGEDGAVLWLALQLYDALGKFASLPLRATAETAKRLLDSLAMPQQAALAAQSQRLQDALESALDQLPFAPPRQPSDPDHWRGSIEQAISEKVDLQLLHWSAGRNLPVARRVTPFYIDETRFGGPALRGWCHQSGHDLWFRLDRILELEIEE